MIQKIHKSICLPSGERVVRCGIGRSNVKVHENYHPKMSKVWWNVTCDHCQKENTNNAKRMTQEATYTRRKRFAMDRRIARRILSARCMRGMTQVDVGVAMQIFRQAIILIEQNRRKVSASELIHFADLFDVSTSWLAGREK